MKTITAREHDLITAVIGDGLTTLAEAVLEKDLLLTEVLQAINATDKDGIGLVFCGGTCLSKAHGLIDRMSEDIDFKLVVPTGVSRSARSRMLSQYKKRLARDLEQLGFHVPADQIVARDENSYVSLNLHYESRFPPVASLRTEIKVELNARPPVLPTASLPIRSMLSTLIEESASGVPIECIGVEETVAEKVLSFLRRTAEVRAGRNRAEYDDRLVRHLYDVRAIARAKNGLQLPHEHFATMVAGDAAQFRNQYPEFEQDPVGQMRAVMEALHNDASAFERDYLRFVDELVFGEPVSFAEARSVFIELAERLMSAVPVSPKSEAALQRMADNAQEIGLDY
jgi:predicted nucleotidyltransferase component of viral defense system